MEYTNLFKNVNPIFDLNRVLKIIPDKALTLDEIEKIRLEDFNNKKIFFDIKVMDDICNWKICNCRMEEIGNVFYCDAYKYNLTEAIELANKHFYEEN